MDRLNSNFYEAMSRVAYRIKELLTHYIQVDIYDAYFPQVYERTGQFINSVEMVATSISDFAIGFNGTHYSYYLDDVSALLNSELAAKLNEGAITGGMPWHEAHRPFFYNTLNALENGELDRMIQEEVAKVGFVLS